MANGIYCITHQHNIWLVLMAGGVCAITSGAALRFMQIGERAEGRPQTLWLWLSGLSAGGGAWASHFIALLAFNPGFTTGYEFGGAAASLALAFLGLSAGVFVAVRAPKPWNRVFWGALFAATVGGMHYLGTWALRVPGALHWDPVYVATSFLVCGVLSAIALQTLQGARGDVAFICATLVLAAAICGLHFIGMAGMRIVADAAISVPSSLIPHDIMALCVGTLTVVILLSGLAAMWVEGRAKSASLQLLQSVIAAMPQGLAYFDAADRYVLGNDTYRREFAASGFKVKTGCTYRQLIAESLSKTSIPAARGREEEWIEELMADRAAGGVRDQTLGDGRFLRVVNNRTADGGLVTVVTDITGLKRQADDLAAARDQAEAATQAKSQFLTNMSHELRTPMNGMIAVADLLADETLTPRQAEMVEMIRSSGATLNRLLCDLLDFASVETGAADIVTAPFDLRGVVQSVIATFAFEAEQKSLAINLDMDAGLPSLVLGDLERVKQVFANLISNAVKFTDAGRIDVTVARQDDMTVFKVHDTGVGFDDNVKRTLFVGFSQADGSSTRRFGGAGLGLAIAGQLTYFMQGKLTCESTPQEGSIFTLVLPLPAVEHRGATGQQLVDAPGAAPPRVLIVDDNATNRRVLGMILDGAGMQTQFAENGQEAVDQWRCKSFDAIFMDIQMPVMDGLAATRTIRALETSEGRGATPIIVVSANAMPEHVEASYDAGADGHVAKPVTASSLFGALEQLEMRAA